MGVAIPHLAFSFHPPRELRKPKPIIKHTFDSKPFLIFALPRSRTSWLSVFLSTDRSFCAHDHGAYSRSLPDLPQYEYVGMACTGAAHEWRQWVEKYPEAPIVVIRRNAFECGKKLAAVMQSGDVDSYVEHAIVWADALEQISHRPNCLTVDFQQMDYFAGLIYRHCLPGLLLDEQRLKLLLTLNIQPDPEKMRAEVARLSAKGWERTT